MKRTLTLLVLLLAAHAAAAQEPVVRLTLDDAMARGLANSQRLAELRAREAGRRCGRGRSRRRHAALDRSPGWLHAHQSRRRVRHRAARSAAAHHLSGHPRQLSGRGLDLAVAALHRVGGAMRSSARRAPSGHASAEDVAAARSDLRLEITRAFWALVTAIEAEQVLARSLDSMAAHVSDLRSRLDQGLIPPNDVLSAEAQQSRQRVLSIEARTRARSAEADLRRLLGLETGRPCRTSLRRSTMPPVARVDARRAPGGSRAVRRPGTARACRAHGRGTRPRERPSPRRRARRSGSTAATTTPGRTRGSFRASDRVAGLLGRVGQRELARSGTAGGVAPTQAEAVAASRAVEARCRRFRPAGRLRSAAAVARARLEPRGHRCRRRRRPQRHRGASRRRRSVSRAGRRHQHAKCSTPDRAVLQAELDRTRALANARLAEARLDRAVGR